MDIITLDFETFYGDGYTLSGKDMTTEAYVRDPRFEAILCSFKVNDSPSFFVPRDSIGHWLERLEIHKHAILMHHAHFDALILNHHYDVRPKLILDTLGMARALHGANGRLSLEKLAERYGIGAKGKEVLNVRGMRFKDFSPDALKRYGNYSCNDSDLTRTLGKIMIPQFSREELQINDHIVRMFTEPVLELDTVLLDQYAASLHAEKMAIMLQAGAQKTDLMSNEKFADMLRELGIDPPMKISPTWLKKAEADRKGDGITYAFAKTDPGMQALQEHPDERVQILIEARLKNKTTIAEKGAERLIAMAGRGAATVYLKYSGASGTHRLSGGDKFNWQSMKRGSDLRRAVMAKQGQKVVVGDSSNIEARLLDWLAGQEDMVQVYIDSDNKVGPDMYCVIAERIYHRSINKKDNPQERQMGKTCLAEGSLVLTDAGLIPIQEITVAHRLWDGVEWVIHEGVICNGEKEIIEYQGLRATPDHEVFCEDGRKIPISQAASEMVRIARTGAGRKALRLPRNYVGAATPYQGAYLHQGALPQQRANGVAVPKFNRIGRVNIAAPQWESTSAPCGSFGASIRCGLGEMYQSIKQAIPRIWRAGYKNDVPIAHGVHSVGGEASAGGNLCGGGDRPAQQRRALRAGKFATSIAKNAAGKSSQYRAGIVGRAQNIIARLGVAVRAGCDVSVCHTARYDGRGNYRAGAQGGAREAQELARDRSTARVYDIVNAGPRNRFTAAGLLVANCKLGLGFGMGPDKFAISVRAQAKNEEGKPLIISPQFSKTVVDIYRAAHPQVGKLWKRCDDALRAIGKGQVGMHVDYRGIVQTCKDGLLMPGGLRVLFPELQFDRSDGLYGEWSFWNGKARERIYGAKLTENIIQCLARIIVFEQCRLTAKELTGIARWVHSVHDEGVFVADDFDAPYVRDRLLSNMRIPPAWCVGLPLNSEGGFAQRYGEAK